MQLGFPEGRSLIHRIDPRARIIAAVAFAVIVAVSRRPLPLAAALGVAILAAGLARLGPRKLGWHLLSVNAFMLLLWIILPLATPGEMIWQWKALSVSREGVRAALEITVKCNAIVLASLALVATLDLVRLGHALHHLGAPEKLVHIFLFTVRYFDLLHHEYHRLSRAMRLRGFRPRVDRHTYRTYGYLIGMLLVNSFDRAERVLAAMKCRGFRGRFYVLRHFAFARRDLVFSTFAVVIVALLGVLQWG
jgi:cobalt/nickel transport system permease protein